MPLSQDLSFAFRQLVRHRIYALTAIASMALGIGATAAVYSVLYGVLIDPYPYRDANRLAFVTLQTKQGHGEVAFTLAQATNCGRRTPSQSVLLQNDESMVATDGEIPQSVKVLDVSSGGLQVLDAPPLQGAAFHRRRSARRESLLPQLPLSATFFGNRTSRQIPMCSGKVLELNQHKYTVIGVVGPRFTWHDSEVYLPMPAGMDPNRQLRRWYDAAQRSRWMRRLANWPAW